GRDVAEGLRRRMLATRDEAVRADAERLAPSSFAAAGAKAREAEAALGQKDIVNAQQRFQEALEGYAAAKSEANREANRVAALARKEGETRAFESQAADARRAAELADAPRLARALWAKGAEAERRAGDAVKQQAFDRAQALFVDAQKAYQEAGRGASASATASTAERDRLETRKRDLEAEHARVAAAKTRQDAEQAAAARRAEADRAAAAEQGRVAALQRQRSEAEQARAEQARSEMTTARHAAEQAGAVRHASSKQLLASAETKERDGQAALGRSDYGAAERLFREAHSGYQSAAQEARRDADAETRVAALKAGSEHSRNRAAARREQAVKAEADHLAKDLFNAAHAKQAEADGLAGRQNFAAANLAYQDAAERYMEAALRAQVVREARAQADSAKTRMLIEKLKAGSDSPEFKAGLVEERQGIALYEQLAYKEAAERFRTAETLFTRAAGSAPPTKRRPMPGGPG
ncbi:MAG: hypothetical protein ACRD1B_10715, partial [Thermoanaerobaculia bacterium]